jgi:hypothetical protein
MDEMPFALTEMKADVPVVPSVLAVPFAAPRDALVESKAARVIGFRLAYQMPTESCGVKNEIVMLSSTASQMATSPEWMGKAVVSKPPNRVALRAVTLDSKSRPELKVPMF